MPHALTEVDKALLNDIYYESLEDLDDPEAMFTYTLAKAMRKHLMVGQSEEHIYLQRFEITQIRLFELLIQQFPLANLSQHCINTLLIDALVNHTNPVLMDIGIGTGFQVSNMIEGLKNKSANQIKCLTIIGIEPFADALRLTEENIRRASKNASFEVKLIIKEAFIEQMTQGELSQMLPAENDGIYVNASFALHHIQQMSQRKAVFEILKNLNVKAFVLSEPNSNHFEPSYPKRFQNCINHYGVLFQIIDTLPINTTEKAALKLFFSREIDDVLGNTEKVRVEKHFATEQWVQLFEETGFLLQKRVASFEYLELNGTNIKTDLPDRYATEFEGEEITSLFWAN
ncbi:transcriptional regulator [Emticicia agri]|uniref:Transcriptional regulator n=2 Tax=Emticicia agri TaxID=2492393 RepID=A0A4Q5M1J7_9BACT|nr:transcriptional regulator [Emticicia agri]